jgi:type VI protein secretion system component Hcp
MNAFLKIPGIRGGSVEPAHVDWIGISGFVCPLVNRPGQPATYGDLRVEKPLDAATPELAAALLAAKCFDEVVIELHPEDIVDTLMILRFRDVRVESQVLGEGRGERLDLHYSGFEFACTSGRRRPAPKSGAKRPKK